MLSIYFMDLIILPFMMLIGMRTENRKKEENLLSKADTKILRGISALFVVMAHYLIYMNNVGGMSNRYIYAVISQLGGIGVLIFFFVSGYGIYASYISKEPDWEFVWKRVKTVYLPYVIIKIVLEAVFSIAGMQVRTWSSALLSILLVEDWFIKVIIIQYIIFFISWRYIGKTRIILFGVFADFIFSAIFIMEKKPIGWFNALWLFTFGLICSKYEKRICSFFKSKLLWKISLLLIGFGITGAIFAVFKGEMWANILKPLSGLLLCLAICGGNRCVRLGSKVMLYAGERSMHIYIVHINMWKMTEGIISPVVRFWAAIILTIIGTEILYRITALAPRVQYILNKQFMFEKQKSV